MIQNIDNLILVYSNIYNDRIGMIQTLCFIKMISISYINEHILITVAEYLWKDGVGLTETVSVVAINK